MRKNIILRILVIFTVITSGCTKEASLGTSICACGDHETGMYQWEVPKGEGCQSGKASNGILKTYEPAERPGVYSAKATVEFDAKEAQKICKEAAKNQKNSSS